MSGIDQLQHKLRVGLEIGCIVVGILKKNLGTLAALRFAFFAPGNDPTVWLKGWHTEIRDSQRAAVAAVKQTNGGRAEQPRSWICRPRTTLSNRNPNGTR